MNTHYAALSALSTARGSHAATFSSVRAAPLGSRRPCSHSFQTREAARNMFTKDALLPVDVVEEWK